MWTDMYMWSIHSAISYLGVWLLPRNCLPYLYLISYPSVYSGESMKAHKSLDAYKFFTSGKSTWYTCMEACQAFFTGRRFWPSVKTAEQINFLENATVDQNNCLAWHEHQAGHITACIVNECLHTSLDNPAKSLLMRIFLPSPTPIRSPALEYGRESEKLVF